MNADGSAICAPVTCGNHEVDPGESCDDGNNTSGDQCPADCGPSLCGNGQLDPGEACENHNTAGDGCSPDCQFEVCGDDMVDPSESCDDGNLLNHDGCSALCTLERDGWTALYAAPDPRAGHAIAYDAARATIVLFGGRGTAGPYKDTWTWDGVAWHRRSPAHAPPARAEHAMAYDGARNRIVMFGGGGRTERSTWEWDGITWIELQPATAPPSRLAGIAMAYDGARHRVVMFGGVLDGVYQNATWEWDGAAWREIVPATTPPPARTGHAMAYDSKRGKVILSGGMGDGGLDGQPRRLGDTWEFDGTSWTERTIAEPPEARVRAAMTFDAATEKIVLFGGEGETGMLGDTWEWDGATWTARLADPAPRARSGSAMAYDIIRARIVLFGGQRRIDSPVTAASLLNDTWARDGHAWNSRIAVHPHQPVPRRLHGLAYDATWELTVQFGGILDDGTVEPVVDLNDTWAWDGRSWRQLTSVNLSAPRSDFAMAAAGGRVVMFGGNRRTSNGIEKLNDTWVMIDLQWVRNTTEPAPPVRAGPAMAYNEAHGRLVMFGGSGRNDTWEWDGSRWTQRFPVHVPPGRDHHVMAYAAGTGRVMMFGGSLHNDTWEWDGIDWTERFPADVPPPAPGHSMGMAYDMRRGRLVLDNGSGTWEWDGTNWQSRSATSLSRSTQAMTYDAARGRVVVAGHRSDGTPAVWEWDGTDWHEDRADGSPPARTAAAMVYDAAHATVVMFGGSSVVPIYSGITGQNDTWLWSGAEWHEQQPTVSPSPRMLHAMAFDSARQRTVLFGGVTGLDGRTADDTWEWDGTTWLQRFPTITPGGRSGHTMVYDAARRHTLLLAGTGSRLGPPFYAYEAVPTFAQWAWNGERWTDITPVWTPSPRTALSATYDAARDRVVLFGGHGRDGAVLGDTWEWDGAHWIERLPTGRVPAPRFGHTLVYDAAGRRSVLFGGSGRSGVLNDIWVWDGTAWTEIAEAPKPLARSFHAMVYDAARGGFVMFAGSNAATLRDTWWFRQADRAVPEETCHTGVDGDGDGRAACEDSDCSEPCAGCGDGVCTGAESCRLCPGDCGLCALCGDLQCDASETCASCPGDCGRCPREAMSAQSAAAPRPFCARVPVGGGR